ncbi:MAG: succinate dehydrogenase/fumarate reductase iron-sulfur subunit [Acidobacteria bacterium]|nr:succinate dehydrogenase/fumarate reductase iron-sulfur subunit [Acidobacteriota bacterium]
MHITLRIWRQTNPAGPGRLVTYELSDVTEDMSLLEVLDLLNLQLARNGEEPIAFDSDCREGICGSCGLQINGRPHGPLKGVASCQIHMRTFKENDTITIEPFRAKAFPVVKDLVIDRTAFDRIIQAGGFISVNTGGAPDANAIPIPKNTVDAAFEAAACISCGACVAACKNASAMLFVAAKVAHLGRLPQGEVERKERCLSMVAQMDAEKFGACSNTYACEAECPKEISVDNIAFLNRELLRAKVF